MSKSIRRLKRRWVRALSGVQLLGAMCVIGALILGHSALVSDGMLRNILPVWGHIVGVVVLFLVGLCSLLCSLELKDLDRPVRPGKDSDQFRTVLRRENAKSGVYRGFGDPANSSDRHRKIIQL